jgi:tetratricopeptide (TPR) repeat protein
MTDEKKPPEKIDEVDWDEALSEWENKSFDPEVAKDVVTDKPGTLSGGSVARPLYRPPVQPPVPPRPRPPGVPPPVPPAARAHAAHAPPPPRSRPAAAPPPPRVAPPLPQVPQDEELLGDANEEDEATLIAAVPRALLQAQAQEQGPKSLSGGLGQLFSRDDKREASVDVSFEESHSQSRTVVADKSPSDPPGEFLTSAKNVAPSRADVADPMPLRRPSLADEPEGVDEDGMYDPFAEPGPRASLKTRPADEEIDALLRTSAPPSLPAGDAEPEPPSGARTQPPPASEPPPSSATEVMSHPEPLTRGPALLAPEARRYDPNEETMVGRAAEMARARAALAARRAAGEDEESTGLDKREPAAPSAAPTRTWADERPASAWLSDGAREGLASRATWLEDEARTLGDKVSRARGLLACSEIYATIGDRERAHSLAAEARDLAPSLALAHRQARALLSWPPDPEDYVVALDAEVKMTPAGPARVHSTLLAADALRASGDDEGAARRLDQAARVTTSDVRASLARAAHALARGDTASPALRLPETPELAPVAEAVRVALRLRGVDQNDAPETAPSPSELLLRARAALDAGDLATAAPLMAELAHVPELAAGAMWVAASLGAVGPARRAQSAQWLRALAEHGDVEARRAVVARALELGDRELLAESLASGAPFTSAERVALATLAGTPPPPGDPQLDAAGATPGMAPLAAACAALSVPAEGEQQATHALARAQRSAGSPDARALVRLGRLLAASVPPAEIESALAGLGETRPAGARAVALEMASRAGRALDVSTALEAWGSARASGDERAVGTLAAALVAERAGLRVRALEAFKAARSADPTNEAALRAIASLEQIDLVSDLNAMADDLVEGPRSALARIEAVTRGEGVLPEPTRAELLERAQRAAPSLPLATFLAERIARRSGDVDEVLRWIRERKASTNDPIEGGLDAVREALLVADRDGALASERLHEAHRARPADVALRELYERMAPEPPADRATWREQRAAEATGDARALLYLEAAHEHERAGDEEGALRAAEAAAATDTPLGRIARERAELRTGNVARLAEELFTAAKGAEDVRTRREAYERLAVLDATARHDPASALLWHRSILEETPGYEPSLRHVEQHFVGEGRDDELEPIASAIANALRGSGAGECTAHAELAARLRMRGAEGSWEATREMVDLAAAEGDPSLWSLRMLQGHARARGDEAGFLAVTLRLLERVTRPAESAALLVRAGEAASRLGDLEQARSLLERATAEDPGDVVAWGLLADVRQRAGDVRSAAEACESLARSSMVREHQLLAWYDAGRMWADEAHDDDRAIVAFEAAAAVDVAHEDVFDRLSRIYATRKMQPELASLLERRLEGISDPNERLAMEVRRGRVLLEVGDTEGARTAFEAALAERPDDPSALSAFADLCVAQRDWDAGEQSLVRLARLLPTPDEQRDVYGRLGDLYAHNLRNLSRAEVAFKEVLKRAPDDATTMEKLVEVHKRQNDPARAVELQQSLIAHAASPEEKRKRVIDLAAIHEQTSHDNRRAEQTLEAARREFPQDVHVLRALAEFYVRHHQAPAMNILLDRASADARRALAAGRFTPGLFEMLATVADLRGKKAAAYVAQGMLAAYEGRPAEIGGASERAFDPRLDDLLAPDVITPALRALLKKTGEALDLAAPLDVRTLKAAAAVPDSPVARLAVGVAHSIGLPPLQVLVTSKAGVTCIPVGSNPPTIVVGESLSVTDRAGAFLVLRALKLIAARASVFARTPPGELAVLVSAWLKCFNPGWHPPGINAAALNAAGGRVQAALPRSLDPDVGVIALEVAGGLGTQAATLGPNALLWADRAALLAMGDANAGLDAIATAAGHSGAPVDPAERATWISRTPEARDLVAFGVTDAFAEARAQAGLDR